MAEKYSSKLSVNLLLTRDNNGTKEVLLQLRKNTGFMDGMYDYVSGGHVENGESYGRAIVRESEEEIGITINEENLFLAFVAHHYRDDYVQLIFTAERYTGVPVIKEKDFCEEIAWFDINHLPENTIPYINNELKCIELGLMYDDMDFTDLKRLLLDEEKSL